MLKDLNDAEAAHQEELREAEAACEAAFAAEGCAPKSPTPWF